MKLISMGLLIILLIAAPIVAYIYISSTNPKLNELTTSINYQLNPKDFNIELNQQSNTLTLNKDNAFVKIDLDSDSLQNFTETWVKINSDENNNTYLPPAGCAVIEINLARVNLEKGQNIKLNDISCKS